MPPDPLAAPALPRFIAERFPYDRHLLELTDGPNAGLRIHTVDHGPRTAPPVLLLHGNPTWSFLWRKVILEIAELRAVAPDLLGLGLSSHLPRIADHTVARHADAITELVERLDLQEMVLAVQDWGGPIGTAVAARVPERVAGIVVANTAVVLPEHPRGTAFHRFARLPVVSDLVFRGLGMPQAALWLGQGDRSSIRGPVARAYRWPLRGWRRRVAPLAMARMVPDSDRHPSLPELRRGEAWIRGFGGPIALVWGQRDPILGGALRRHERELRPLSVRRTAAGHFLQEEVPGELAAAIREVVAAR